MKSASPAATAIIAAGQFLRADLYRFTLASGSSYHFTSHEVPLTVSGTTYLSGLIIRRGSLRQKVGLDVASLELEISPQFDASGGAPTIAGLSFLSAVRAGVFDSARVLMSKLFLAAWSDTSPGAVPWFQGRVNMTRAGRSTATISINSDTELLNVAMPRNVLQAGCIHTLFDAGCAVSRPAFTQTSAVSGSPTAIAFNTSGLTAPDGWFDLGSITFTSGANAGISRSIKSYVNASGRVTLVAPLPVAPAPGDGFSIVPGCDKRQATCSSKFSNLTRFRGFPYVPLPETMLDGGAVASPAPTFGSQGSLIGGSDVSGRLSI